MVRIINGVVFEDGKPGKRVINTNGGNYVEKIEGDYIAGTVINHKPTPTRQGEHPGFVNIRISVK
jgi:hypothetical protein